MKLNSLIIMKIFLYIFFNVSELIFLIIKKFEYKLKDNNLNKVVILEDILSMWYLIYFF